MFPPISATSSADSRNSNQTRLLLEVRSITMTSTEPILVGAQGANYERVSQPDPEVSSEATAIEEIEQDTNDRYPNSPKYLPREVHDLKHRLSKLERQDSGDTPSFMKVETVLLYRKRCSASCQCQCHRKRTDFRSRMWGWAVLGRFFLHYNSLPLPRGWKCNAKGCRGSRARLHLTYHFPSWAWNRAVCISLGANGLMGEAGLQIRVPRILAVNNAPAWSAAWGGDSSALKYWLSSHTYSPFDIQGDGASLLLVSKVPSRG